MGVPSSNIIYLFIYYGLLKDNFTMSDGIASNSKMVTEQRTGNSVEESSRDLLR